MGKIQYFAKFVLIRIFDIYHYSKNKERKGGAFMASSLSISYQLKNWSSTPIYFVDGWGEVVVIPSSLNPALGAPGDIPPEHIGALVVERNNLTFTEEIGDSWIFCAAEVLARIPSNPQSLNAWMQEIPQLNMIFFGSENRARLFAVEQHSLARYRNRTNYGTAFTNSLNYSFINCTGQTLYLVDGFGSEIMEVPSGDESPFMYLDSGKLNSKSRPTFPYVRMIRFTVTDTAGMQVNYGDETVFWKLNDPSQDTDFPGEHIYRYVDEINAVVCSSREEAQRFISEHDSVAAYMRSIFYLDLKDDVSEVEEDAKAELRVTRNRLIWIFSTLWTLQIGSMIGTFLVDQMSITAAERRKERNSRHGDIDSDDDGRRSKTGGPSGKGVAKIAASIISNVAQNIRRR